MTVSGGAASLTLKVIIKGKDKTLKPFASLHSGTGKEYLDTMAIYSQTPDSQIFYILDKSSTNSTLNSSNITWNESKGCYTAPSYIKEYSEPLVVGVDITKDNYYFHAVAIKRNGTMKLSDVFNIPLDYAEAPDVWGDITGSDKTEIGSSDKIPAGIWVPESQLKDTSLVFTGKPVTIQGLRVYYGNTLLDPAKDYMVRYLNNTNAGTPSSKLKPTVDVTLKGDRTGKGSFNFTIAPATLNKSDVTYTPVNANVRAGFAQTPDVRLNKDGKPLRIKSDYTLSYAKEGTGTYSESVTDEGVYDVKVTGAGNYTGDFVLTRSVFIVSKSALGIDKATLAKMGVQNIADPTQAVR
ncbi:MAG: hypothetical protein K5857_10070 [Lachnospiraceae bacterium]|nr:hypothetical protein [Lachnospiraceae bacterium]